ncbi:MAPEG family protein [Roseovarius pelagicus]|uniref:MAPEG family protein n=1 Tax=Roseovarius pelagicus TaxID=2980108 RepID=A0ABY6DJY8_9RHOB|nr:MAPEG family protein [Roseovarius pelagicus]UXX84080.1 MAPEG family protein [Roseovarius pelagicus]
MNKRAEIMVGMAAGMLWGLALLWVAGQYVTLPVFALMPTIMTAFLLPGLFMLLVIGRLAQRRYFDDTIIDGQPFAPASGAAIDQRVLTNTTEQLVLALAIWPAAAVLLAGQGPGVIATLGIGFVIARLLFWVGYHVSPPLRAFGFAATFYPTILVALWALARLAFGGG